MNGRPHIAGAFRLPVRQTVRPAPELHLLIDTGADVTLVPPEVYRAVGLTFDDFRDYPPGLVEGVAGAIASRRVTVTLIMKDSDRTAIEVRVRAHVLGPMTLEPPALLGRDVTDRYRLIIDRGASIIALTDSSPAI